VIGLRSLDEIETRHRGPACGRRRTGAVAHAGVLVTGVAGCAGNHANCDQPNCMTFAGRHARHLLTRLDRVAATEKAAGRTPVSDTDNLMFEKPALPRIDGVL